MIPAASARVAQAAKNIGLEIAVREFPDGTRTAEDAARAIGVEGGQIVKSLVFLADGEPVVCLISGANRLDTARLADAANAAEVRRADADAVREATGFAVGGVPPFGHARALRVFCDRDLLQHDTVWAAAGTPMSVFAVDPRTLARACNAAIADLGEKP
jgi:Cys-tRNA(Pro) deacylase